MKANKKSESQPVVAAPGAPWKLYSLSGPRAEARAKVVAMAQITPATRDYIVELIDALPAEAYGVEVNAFGARQSQGSKRTLFNHQFSVVGIS